MTNGFQARLKGNLLAMKPVDAMQPEEPMLILCEWAEIPCNQFTLRNFR